MNCMNFFRYFLMTVSIVAGVCSLVAVKTTLFRHDEAVIIFVIGMMCTLNYFYLVQAPAPNSRPSIVARIVRMIGLWFATKEADLKRRSSSTAAG